MFHICFYLRLDIVYVYVMPRPPSIETIPGASLDQANIFQVLSLFWYGWLHKNIFTLHPLILG